ncbi:hypothetical protein ABT010_05060 [Streptomyces sp. NPDC002668]|uniref:hypothetical protein n=1 Tax=Streptomyces sp. NPDC002668 TaxID=3154422 RepID=UPI003322A8CF
MSNFPDEPPMGRPTEFGDISPFTLERREYLGATETPVYCLPVTLRGQLIGYVWASGTADAASFCARRGTGAAGFDAGGPWRARLRKAREDGLSPLEAIRLWVGRPEDPTGGGVLAGAEEQVMPNSQAVRALASRSAEGEGK